MWTLQGDAPLMSASDESFNASVELEESPKFELECLFDDVDNPSELTIFSPDGTHTATEWITVERAAAVSIDELR